MEGAEVTFREVIFGEDLIIVLVENRRIWRQSRSRERERRVRSPSSSRSGLRTSMSRDRIRCFKCREYDHLQMSVQIWFPRILIGKVMAQGQYH